MGESDGTGVGLRRGAGWRFAWSTPEPPNKLSLRVTKVEETPSPPTPRHFTLRTPNLVLTRPLPDRQQVRDSRRDRCQCGWGQVSKT